MDHLLVRQRPPQQSLPYSRKLPVASTTLSERFRRAVIEDDTALAKQIYGQASSINSAPNAELLARIQGNGPDIPIPPLRRAQLSQYRADPRAFNIRNEIDLKRSHVTRDWTNWSSDARAWDIGLGIASSSAMKLREKERVRKSGRCQSSLALAVEHGASLDMVKWLLDIGHERDLFSRDLHNRTIVSLAAQSNRPDVIEACCVNAVANAAALHHARSVKFTSRARFDDIDDEEEDLADEKVGDGAERIGQDADGNVGHSMNTEDMGPATLPTGGDPMEGNDATNRKGTNFPPGSINNTTIAFDLPRIDDIGDKGPSRAAMAPRNFAGDLEAPSSRTSESGDIVQTELRELLDWPDDLGRTALTMASMQGFEEVVRLLVDLGADIDLPDTEGNTPLHYAASYNHLLVVQLLIERGCSFAAKNVHGFLAADYAYTLSLKGAIEAFGRAQYEGKKLARKKANNSAGQAAAEPHGTTPLRSQSSLTALFDAVNAARTRSAAHSPSPGHVNEVLQHEDEEHLQMKSADSALDWTLSPNQYWESRGSNHSSPQTRELLLRPDSALRPHQMRSPPNRMVPLSPRSAIVSPNSFHTNPRNATPSATPTTNSTTPYSDLVGSVADRVRLRDAAAMSSYRGKEQKSKGDPLDGAFSLPTSPIRATPAGHLNQGKYT